MDDNLAIFLILAISIAAAVVLATSISWMRINARLRLAAAAGGAAVQPQVEHLTGENAALRDEVGGLHARIAVLEQIVTDPATRTSLEIEQLR